MDNTKLIFLDKNQRVTVNGEIYRIERIDPLDWDCWQTHCGIRVTLSGPGGAEITADLPDLSFVEKCDIDTLMNFIGLR